MFRYVALILCTLLYNTFIAHHTKPYIELYCITCLSGVFGHPCGHCWLSFAIGDGMSMTYNGCDQNHVTGTPVGLQKTTKNDAFWPKMASACCATDHEGLAMRSLTWGVFGPSTEAVYLIDMILWRVCLYLMSPRQVITCKTTTNQVTSRRTAFRDFKLNQKIVENRSLQLPQGLAHFGLGPPNISRVRHARSKLSL